VTSASGATARWAAWGLVAVAVLARAAPLALGDRVLEPTALDVVAALPLPVVGAVLVTGRRGGALGWLLLAGGLGQVLGSAFYPDVDTADMGTLGMRWVAWASQEAHVLSMVALASALVLFPDGRLPGDRWRWLRFVGGGAVVAFLAASASAWPDGIYGVAVRSPVESPVGAELLTGAFAVGMVLVAVLVAAGLAGQVVRWRAGDPELRAQLSWALWGIGLCAVVVAVNGLVGAFGGDLGWLDPLMSVVVLVVLPVCLGMAIARARLYDIDLVVNRTLVYAVLTAVLVAAYAAVVTTVTAGFGAGDRAGSLVAVAVIAVAFSPVRQVLQRLANRLVFGERDEPYEVLAGLGRSLESQVRPTELPDVIVDGITRSLRIPYAAISLDDGCGSRTVVERGRLLGAPLVLDLRDAHERVGTLTIGARSPHESFGRRERRLLEDLARHAGVALANARLAMELQRSREQLVEAREEERRRIWRDLHDGLGPTLTGVSLGLAAARRQVGDDDEPTAALLHELAAQVHEAIDDTRRLVHDLRPPLLDELGLIGAVERQVSATAATADVEVELHVCPELSDLPAGVELAAYRITLEAVTNAVRHAHCRRCRVTIGRTNGSVTVRVTDDGTGLPDAVRPGNGLASMRQRAAELGGTCTVVTGPSGGTTVHAALPVDRVDP
jgi:signal transduction histidine kinase